MFSLGAAVRGAARAVVRAAARAAALAEEARAVAVWAVAPGEDG